MMMQTATTTLLDDLILVRLLTTGKRSPTESSLRKELLPVCAVPPTPEQVETALQGLADGALLTQRPLRLTEEGRQRALAFLGVERLPPRADWRKAKEQLLLFRAHGV